MINPSEINLSSLPWLPLDARSAFPKNPAIYFAIDPQGKIQYIGRSLNPKSRWANHHKYEQLEAIGSVKIVYLFVDSPDLLSEIESALILWFDPPLNLAGKSTNSLNGNRIMKLRERANLTQRQVAEALGKTDQTVSNWENGVRLPKLTPSETLVLCRVLKCTLEELAGEIEGISKG